MSNRIFGLDLLRALAIIFVVIGHANILLEDKIPYIDGVDLFFVLSGFLVGKILLENFTSGTASNFQTLKNFWVRRWFRTLPNYFLFLCINIILVYFGLIKGELNIYVFSYFVFLQNLLVPVDFIFWESWSLSIEEWFYLLFPIVLVIGLSLKGSLKRVSLFAILMFIFFPLFYRILLSDSHVSIATWDLYYRKLVVTRLDSIGFGLAGAFVSFYFFNFWQKYKYILFIVGFGVYVSTFFIEKQSFYGQTFYFTQVSLGIALWLPFLSELNLMNNFKTSWITYLSKISFSMYLIHLPILQLLISLGVNNRITTIPTYLFYWAVIIILSGLVYKYFEKPTTDLRERLVPKTKV